MRHLGFQTGKSNNGSAEYEWVENNSGPMFFGSYVLGKHNTSTESSKETRQNSHPQSPKKISDSRVRRLPG